MNDLDAFKWINEVENFLMSLMDEHRKNNPQAQRLNIPYDSIPYGEALLHWYKNGKDSRAMFSSDDPTVLFFRKELTEQFGLEILTNEEAEERKKIIETYRTMKVTGFPSSTKLLN